MTFTAPLQKDAIRIMLLGSGELGKEVAIEAQRLGIEVIAVDKYENAPAHLVANRSYAIDMQDKSAVLELIEKEQPSYILPEVEAISISALFEAEKRGFHVIPNAEAVNKTMNRKNIRVFAAETLDLKTSGYEFVTTLDGLKAAGERIGFPCVIKPVMSSSGHGQSIAKTANDIERSWEIAKEARGDASELIVEEFVPFDYEITLLTVRNETGTTFCEPIGHVQKDGDFILSWQPMQMSPEALKKAQEIAKAVTDGLGGRGIFGVEFFVKDEEVYFSELSPRPHDTGMVTLITQSQSEFALHVRAVLGLPLDFTFYGAGACGAYKAKNESHNPVLEIPDDAFTKDSFVRVFGKPESHVGRRMAVSLVLDEVKEAKRRATEIVETIDDH
ncbi:formate-dependent phosphoribosylglycinamide formyltransferase [Sulfurovum sp. NBC37-1]|uniref:Formate-dependent phosphoribosylglycinamide formyltransferase n=1 Tax=Sulfurovum sp. (strain NBC37-1) TaxID=387093 RepID=PURT_SULNB|nr:formate-dependent phosphoribosylglycinamide formyltransferase [Sulfurovum sp. NBC37-1]A6Q6K6.1 RecName: Full=Formate-dependent phosphoribosylglycinamide formyltransferase; AltName: Full=5'-phosphoribosylglycinamide transformylase 2; AltName: Full=Formate-dependent GAR transformylase; AltName: Full=GAR transformylase 2; Short=GART 2; AltName: Full=Non-folate glycinamide ribonucleotide transformylase; AltName: Full=Phosphoribosylglycinamide formyltransferase 2 [Sulfurovum sp. NBC37-1]BAF71115.1 